MKVAVLGSGIIGVSTAWWLSQQGCEVVVVDRGTGPAQETSRANGGQISVSYAEPWANPGAPLKLLQWLGKEDAPLLFRLRPEWLQWKWAINFLRECTPARTADNIRQRYWLVSGMQKLDALTRILEAETFDGMIIFARTKAATAGGKSSWRAAAWAAGAARPGRAASVSIGGVRRRRGSSPSLR